MAEVTQLLDQEIPEGRQHLQESYINLDKVAQYCRDNYLKVVPYFFKNDSCLRTTQAHSFLFSLTVLINSIIVNSLLKGFSFWGLVKDPSYC